MSARIILLRHGQTFSNVERALDTRPPGAELTERGRAQAADVGAELAGLLCAGDGELGSVERIVCSVALRAQQTALLAARAFEKAADAPRYSLPIDVTAGIHEISVGSYEMDTSEEAYRAYTTALRGWLDGDDNARIIGGENHRDLLTRYQPVLEDIAATQGEKDVIVVSHGAAIRVVARHAAALDPDFAFTGYLANCRFIVLEPRGKRFGEWTITRWADTAL
ncbi:MAG: histidine phosphatase family protein [Corynebacterium sp.]|nr:histidine phosphatase family protein [Corynebacterium sp.]